jgi:hypothetical protein
MLAGPAIATLRDSAVVVVNGREPRVRARRPPGDVDAAAIARTTFRADRRHRRAGRVRRYHRAGALDSWSGRSEEPVKKRENVEACTAAYRQASRLAVVEA